MRLAHKEITDLLGDRVADVPQNQREVRVDLQSQIADKSISLRRSLDLLLGWRLIRVLRVVGVLLGDSFSDLALLGVHLIFLEVEVVCEVVVQLSINNRFNKSSGVVAQILQDLNNNIHDHRAQGWEAQEHAVNDLVAEAFKLSVDVVQAVESRLSELL